MTIKILPDQRPARWRRVLRLTAALAAGELLRALRSWHWPLAAAVAAAYAADLALRALIPLAVLAGRAVRWRHGQVAWSAATGAGSAVAVAFAGMYTSPPGSYPWMLPVAWAGMGVALVAAALALGAVLHAGRRTP